MSQNIFSIKDNNIPVKDNDFILLDTNVVIDLTGYGNSTSNRAVETVEFMKDMSHRNSIFVVPLKVWEELNIIVERDIIGNQHKNPNVDLNALTNNVETTLLNLKNSLNIFPNIYPEPIGQIDNNVCQKANENRKKYGLKWGDAIILAIAQEENINNILTFDKDYIKISDPNINILLNSELYNRYSNQTQPTGNIISVNNT